MPRYLTWERSRQRWVFQRRIPTQLRPHFGGTAVIREHIGRVDEPYAVAFAKRRAAELDAQFARLRSSEPDRTTVSTPRPSLERFVLDKALLNAFLATWRTKMCDWLEEQMRRLRGADDLAWEDLDRQLTDRHQQAVRALRRGDAGCLEKAARTLEEAHRIRFTLDPVDQDELVNAFNSTCAATFLRFRAVLAGEAPLTEIRPAPAAQLPLVDLWGDRADALIDRWQDTRVANGERINTKTLDKYRKIVRDLGALLGRRPIQSLREADLDALVSHWLERGNKADTIQTKVIILKGLVRPFLPVSDLDQLFRKHRRRRERGVRRLPFSPEQIPLFMEALEQTPGISEADIRCVELLALTGAHLEEIYQLRAVDLKETSYGWLTRIAEASDTGIGGAKLKTPACSRELPVCIPDDIFPDLSPWLRRRVNAGGHLFDNPSSNRHGIRSAAASKRLNRVLRQLFPTEHRLVLQSFRNTLSAVMRRAGVSPRIERRYLGHADLDIHEKHYDNGQLLDETDLLPASEAVVRWLRVQCFSVVQYDRQTEAHPFLDDRTQV